MVCPVDAELPVDQSHFWDGTVHWDAHRIGWAISGGTAALTVLITLISVIRHARNYRVPEEQRQIIRILYMPPVYAIISFFSYRFFRSYTYYELVEVVYESITLSAFLLLLIQYVAATGAGHSATAALTRKDKRPLPLPFCCMRYRPTKPKFIVAGIITEYYGVLCESSWSYKYASVYITSVDFVSITFSLYGLFLFYELTKEELIGKKPLAKFLCIKLIVMATFYQSFIFSALQSHGIITETHYWTATNVADGLNALTTCIEMVFFALAMMFAYPASEYYNSQLPRRSAWRAIWDSINYSDFGREIYTSSVFIIDYLRGKPATRPQKDKLEGGRVDYAEAFNIEDPTRRGSVDAGRPFIRNNLTSPVSSRVEVGDQIGMRPLR